MPLRINPKTKFKLIQRTNLKILRREDNVGINFKLTAREKNNPFTIIPEKVYNDFDRKAFKRHRITFPIKVPIWYKPVYVPKEIERTVRELPRHVNYAHLTGNQLLLTLLKYDDLSPEELTEVFFNIARRPEARSLDLEGNELVKPAISHFLRQVDGWTMDYVTRMMFSLYELDFKNEGIWSKARRLFMDKLYAYEKISSTYFTQAFIILWDKFKEDMTAEEKGNLIEQLPRYLRKMTPQNFIKTFEICVDNQIISSRQDYLYDRHYFMMLWKTPAMLGIDEFRRALACLKKLDFVRQDPEFVAKEFLPAIKNFVLYCKDNKQLNDLIKEIDGLVDHSIDRQVVESYSGIVFQRLTFVETKLKILDKTDFIEIVKSDLKRFRLKQMSKLTEDQGKLLGLGSSKKAGEASEGSDASGLPGATESVAPSA